jgi:hypothetical protein
VPRWTLLVLAALVLAVPSASAARQPCWQGALADLQDNGKLDRTWKCNCLQEAISHLTGSRRVPCGASVLLADRLFGPHVAAAPAKPKQQAHHINWPARVSASILLVVACVLLYSRRKKSATSRGARRGRGRE